MGFGVEVDEVVGEERDGMEAGFEDVGVKLEALWEGAGVGEGEEEVAEVAVVLLEAVGGGVKLQRVWWVSGEGTLMRVVHERSGCGGDNGGT